MLEMEQALERILERVRPLDSVAVPLREALGSFLAEEVAADIDLPPFDNSAVDGYAVRATDTVNDSASPVRLKQTAVIAAGQTAGAPIAAGTTRRIMTGAPIPDGADAVVMIEDTRPSATRGDGDWVEILEAAVPEQHVRRAGEDLRRGEVVLRPGHRIRPQEIAMLATLGRSSVRVTRRPRAAVFSTGDELVDIASGELPGPGKIRDSNRYTLAALVEAAGGIVTAVRHVRDDPEETEAALREFAAPDSGVDLVVTAGGVSVGDYDYVKPAVEKIGELMLWKVAIKPGKPLAFGRLGSAHFFGLPGNPISAMVTFELFVRPALRRMQGAPDHDLGRSLIRARVMETVPHAPGRREYVRAVTVWTETGYETRPAGGQGSGMLQSGVLANSLLVAPTEAKELPAGSFADVMLMD